MRRIADFTRTSRDFSLVPGTTFGRDRGDDHFDCATSTATAQVFRIPASRNNAETAWRNYVGTPCRSHAEPGRGDNSYVNDDRNAIFSLRAAFHAMLGL